MKKRRHKISANNLSQIYEKVFQLKPNRQSLKSAVSSCWKFSVFLRMWNLNSNSLVLRQYMPTSKDFSNIELLLFHPSPESQERLYLILIISVTCGVVLCLLIVVTRLIFTRKRKNDDGSDHGKSGGQFKTSNTGETTITNGFSDDISEIDADIDLTTPIPMSTSSHVNRNDVSPLLRLNSDIIMFTLRLILYFHRTTIHTLLRRVLTAILDLRISRTHRRHFWCHNRQSAAMARDLPHLSVDRWLPH